MIRDCYEKHADAEVALTAWYRVAKNAEWKDLNDLIKDYPSADLIADNRVIFNIKGNHIELWQG